MSLTQGGAIIGLALLVVGGSEIADIVPGWILILVGLAVAALILASMARAPADNDGGITGAACVDPSRPGPPA